MCTHILTLTLTLAPACAVWLWKRIAQRFPDRNLRVLIEAQARLFSTATELVAAHRKAVDQQQGQAAATNGERLLVVSV